jgi:hypothetical protein
MERNQMINIIKTHSKIATDVDVENLADHIIAVVAAHYEALEKECAVSRIDRKARGARYGT